MVNNGLSAMILTADPHFSDMALDELVLACPSAQVVEELAPGVWRVALPDGFFPLAEAWRQRPPIFVRHICPVMLTLALDEAGWLEQLTAVLRDYLDPTLPFSVQARAFGTTAVAPAPPGQQLANALQAVTGAPIDPRRPAQIVSLVANGRLLYAGYSLVEHNLSNWAGGARRFARQPEQISRAEFKLLEALELFGLTLPPGGKALDLGAAPGGWTRILAARGMQVTAVDPANLHPSLRHAPGVRHLRLTAEAYLAATPDCFDVMLNDMRQDARDSARLMVAYAPYLVPGGFALMTLKLPENGRSPILTEALKTLRRAYVIAGARQLFHNRSEITVYVWREEGVGSRE